MPPKMVLGVAKILWLVPCWSFHVPARSLRRAAPLRGEKLEWNDELRGYQQQMAAAWDDKEIGVAVPSDPVASAIDAGSAAADALRAGRRRMTIEARQTRAPRSPPRSVRAVTENGSRARARAPRR